MKEMKNDKFVTEKLQKPVLDLSVISENKQRFKGNIKWLIPSSEISKVSWIKREELNEVATSGSLLWFLPDPDLPRKGFPINTKGIFYRNIKSGPITIGSTPYSSFNFILQPDGNYFASLTIRFGSKLPESAWVIGEIFIHQLNVFESFSLCAEDDKIRNQQVITFDKIVNSYELLKTIDKKIDIVCYCSITIDVKEVECVIDKYKVNFTRNYAKTANVKNESRNYAETKDVKMYNRNYDYLIDPIQIAQQNDSFSDIILKVENCEIKSHRAVLAKVPFFENLFHENESKHYFELTDLSYPVLHVVLNYLYTEVVPELNFSLACKVYVVSSDLKIFGLKNICSSYLGSNMTLENVFIVISLSDKYADVALKKECIRFIRVSNVEMLTAESIIL